jgi:hypothetical protein
LFALFDEFVVEKGLIYRQRERKLMGSRKQKIGDIQNKSEVILLQVAQDIDSAVLASFPRLIGADCLELWVYLNITGGMQVSTCPRLGVHL